MDKLETYIRQNSFERPTLVLDVSKVEENYHNLKTGLGNSHIHYAVKANPQKEILERLVELGSKFDAASAGEIEMCLNAGAKPEHITFGNTVKRVADIQYAYSKGITIYSADAEEELEKIATHAPNSSVFIRILMQTTEAEWPLSRKFGCSDNYVVPLMHYAKELGLKPIGVSFHVGSQTRHPHMWDESLDTVAYVWNQAKEEGFDLTLLNIGGGFPAYYGVNITSPVEYGKYLMDAIQKRFGDVEYIMAEPGRGMVGNCGMMAATVLLVSRKVQLDPVRWVYLDVGKFSGMAETDAEAIKYQFIVPDKEGSDTDYCILAGPTCDSADVLYETHKILLPVDLKSGDKIIVKSCGAYTTTYSTVAFNGFPPLKVVVL